MPKLVTPLSRAQALRTGAALLINSGSNSILGVLYWVLAARSTSAEELGRGSTLVSTLVVASGLSQLNYSRRLPYLIPRSPGLGKLILLRAYVRALAVSGLLATSIWYGIQVLHPPNVPVLHLWGGLAFVVGTMLWSVFAMQDAALTAFRLTGYVPIENTLFGLLKLAGLVVLPMGILSGTWVITLSWIAPLLLLVVGVNYVIFVRHQEEGTTELLPTPRGSASRGLIDAFGSYALMTSPLILQYVVLTRLDAASAAVVFIPLTLAGSADALSGNIGNAITAEVTRNDGQLPREMRRLILYLVGAATLSGVVALFIGKPLLQLFGERYSQSSLTLLICFAFAAAARAAVFCSAAVQRARSKAVRTMLLQLTIAIGPLLSALMIELHQIRLTGVAVVWLITSLCAAVIGLVYARWPRLTTTHSLAGEDR